MMLWLRTTLFSAAFIATFFIWLPRWILSATGHLAPRPGAMRIAAAMLLCAGAAMMIWCVGTFGIRGRGTPAPFDPPRQLVVRGPYRHVRNPMYIGGILVLLGEALLFGSVALLEYTAAFWLATHLLVTGYEERALTRSFGPAYTEYCAAVGRWLPRVRPRGLT